LTEFVPRDPDFAARVRASFARQKFMTGIGARLVRIDPGLVEIELPYRDDLTQQHGYFHGGVSGALADTAGGYAAFTLFPADSSVLTVEYKINLLAPAAGDRLLAIGRVVRPGRSLTVSSLEVFALAPERRVLCASGQQTLICLHGRAEA
jgi:uncharacterized protein (TIGR00369 family)